MSDGEKKESPEELTIKRLSDDLARAQSMLIDAWIDNYKLRMAGLCQDPSLPHDGDDIGKNGRIAF